MARVRLPEVIRIAIRKADPTNSLKFFDEYQKGINNIAKMLGKRTQGYVQSIAPYNYGDLGGEHGRLKNDIETDISENLGEVSIDTRVNSQLPVKAIVQEFGYPKDMKKGTSILEWDDTVARWRAPYKPNPKRKSQYSGHPAGRIKGLGYLRVGAFMAGESLLTDKPTIGKKPTPQDVRDYRKNIQSRFNQLVKKYTLAFAKGNKGSVPNYVFNKVKLPEQGFVSKYTSNLNSNIAKVPLNLIISESRFDNNVKFSRSAFLKGSERRLNTIKNKNKK
jgi:hypothetical protein